jgi:hypothetical protein
VRAPAAEFFEAALRRREASGEWAVARVDVRSVPRLFEDGERGDIELWRIMRVRPTIGSTAAAATADSGDPQLRSGPDGISDV